MDNLTLYHKVTYSCSKLTTRKYSTSFSLGIRFLNKELRDPIYAIYGFVRFADEIVDTFHDHPKSQLLDEFRDNTYKAIDQKISLNPILHAFQDTVNRYSIDRELIDTFLDSMEMDLDKTGYNQEGYEKYILGSAEVVGLMCLKVFVKGEEDLYQKTKFHAMKLGSAFQKINFLRDLKDDYNELGRTYFPGIEMGEFNDDLKRQIELDIEKDFQTGYEGIKMLPKSSRLGVYVAYVYYYRLFKKIQKSPSSQLLVQRVRIPNQKKAALFLKSYLRHSLNMI